MGIDLVSYRCLSLNFEFDLNNFFGHVNNINNIIKVPPPSKPTSPNTVSSILENKSVQQGSPSHHASTSKVEEESIEEELVDEIPKSAETLSPKLVRKLWVDVLNDNRNPAKGRSMTFTAPKIVNGEIEMEIDDEDVISELNFWQSSLVLYALGGELNMNVVKNFMVKSWNFLQLPDMYYHEEGYFILQFKTFRERDEC
ncbi:unnamed protein product [Vicia faba]|uniref:DUF4283 domain-containing protein n=1 Tax=Vicia faba TaxID=3906 RepID=A0AAV0YWS1_VICFA|nr:unnamed protein product [Vicia faba]